MSGASELSAGLPMRPQGVLAEGGRLLFFGALALLSWAALFTYIVAVEFFQVSGQLADEPLEFEPITLNETKRLEIAQRSKVFEETAAAGDGAVLRVSGGEINQWFSANYPRSDLLRYARLRLEGNRLLLPFSLPVSRERGQTKYLNGRADFELRIDSGRVELALKELRFGGRPAPKLPMRLLGLVDLGRAAVRRNREGKYLRSFSDFEIDNGTAVFRSN